MLVALTLAGQHTSNVTSTWLAIYALSDPKIMYGLLLPTFCFNQVLSWSLGRNSWRNRNALEKRNWRTNPWRIWHTWRIAWRKCYAFDHLLFSSSARLSSILFTRVCSDNHRMISLEMTFGRLQNSSRNIGLCVSCCLCTDWKITVCESPGIQSWPLRQPGRQERTLLIFPVLFGYVIPGNRYSSFQRVNTPLGRHACIGEKFAFLQVKTVFSTILKHYDLELVGKRSDYPVDNSSLIAQAKGPVLVQYRKKVQQK